MNNINSINTNNQNKQKIKISSAIGSAIGIALTVGGVYALSKKNNPNINFKNLNYEEKDILMIGAGSILGGLASGLYADKNEKNKIPKIREALQQFFGGLVCPITILSIANKIYQKSNFKLPNINIKSDFIKNTYLALPKVLITIA